MVVFLCASWEGRRDICHVNMSLVEIVTAENFNCQIRVEESTLGADFKRNKNPFTIFSFSCQNARFNKRGEVVTNFHKIFIKIDEEDNNSYFVLNNYSVDFNFG